MAARKLQAEMDRTYKRIVEGVENFQDIESKMNVASTTAQKEKYEGDLKNQIKKLQRLRDQVKTWQTGTEVKDKGPLVEHRKLIEVQMERFKVIEKEMKTKAYSKEGLISSNRMDPKEQARIELTHWIAEKVEELQRQVEAAEAEVELLHAGTKKKGKAGEAGQARIELLELQNERRQWHVSQLEIIMRLLENAGLKAEEVEGVKEDVDFFVQMNAEEDFDYDEGVYADLNLDNFIDADIENDSLAGSDVEPEAELPPRTPLKRSAIRADEEEKEEPPSAKKASLPRPRARSIAKPEPPKPPVITANFASVSMASAVRGGSATAAPAPAPATGPSPTPAPARPPLRYAAAAAMAPSGASTSATMATPQTVTATSTIATVAPSQPAPSAATQQQPTPATTYASATPASDHVTPISPSVQDSSLVDASPVLSSLPGRETNLGSIAGDQKSGANALSIASRSIASPLNSIADPSTTSPQALRALNPPGLASNQETAAVGRQPQVAHQPTSQRPHQAQLSQQQPSIPAPPGLRESGVALQPSVSPGAPHGVIGSGANTGANGRESEPAIADAQRLGQIPGQQGKGASSMGTISDLVTTFQNVQRKAYQRMGETDHMQEVLDMMTPSAPEPRDAERPKHHAPRFPMATPSYYPQHVPAVMSTPEFFEKLDIEQLFWAFYYLPGTYQQWLAAQMLQLHSWRFHVKYSTWFQRHTKPDEVTDTYEKGEYLYFDWEGSWCVRKKSNFVFEYRDLSD